MAGFDISGIFSYASNLFLVLLFLAALAGGTIVLFVSGFFERRPYKCYIWVERANNFFELIGPYPGRILKGEKFGIKYGFLDEAKTSEPQGKYIYPGKIIHFYRTGENAHYPCKIEKNSESELFLDPSMAPEARISHANQIQENVRRFSKPSLLQQYLPFAAMLFSAIIIGLAFLFGTGSITAAMAGAAEAWKEPFKDAKVITIDKNEPKTPIGAPINPQIPIPPG